MSEWVVKARFPVPVETSTVAADWAARGYSCGPFVDPPGREWNGFVHDTNELVTVVEGRLDLVIEGQSFAAGPGDEIFIPGGAVHFVRNVDEGTTRWLFGYD